jgi:hypothetical protein
MTPREAEEFLRALAHPVGVILDQADAEADPGSPGWNIARAAIVRRELAVTTDPYEQALLRLMLAGYLIAAQVQAPAEHRSELVTQAARRAGIPLDDGPVFDGPDDSPGSDATVEVHNDRTRYAEQASQGRAARAAWSRPAQPRDGAQAISRTSVRSVARRRAAAQARARARQRAVWRFRRQRG